MKQKQSLTMRHLCGAFSVVYFLTNCAFVHAAESNFWAERRKATHQFKQTEEPSAQNLSTEKYQMLAQLPTAQNVGISPAMLTVTAPSPLISSGLDQTIRGAQGVPAWLSDLVLPYGALREVRFSKNPGAPLILHIQDVHGQYDAQLNIARIIRGLREQRGLKLVGLEGAQGAFDLENFKAHPESGMNDELADFFLKRDDIGGAEFDGLTAEKPAELWGIETAALYQEHVRATQDALDRKEQAKQYSESLRNSLEPLKAKIYSDGLKEYDQAVGAYQAKQSGLGAYVKYLMAMRTDAVIASDRRERSNLGSEIASSQKSLLAMTAPRAPRDDSFPNLRLLVNALFWEERLDFKAVESERKVLLQTLAAKLDKAALSRLVQVSLSYKAGRVGYGDFYAYVKTLCADNGIRLAKYEELNNYILYVQEAERINRNDLLTELTDIERDVQDSLARTPEQKALVSIVRDQALLHKLLKIEMTPDDWARYESRREQIVNIVKRIKELSEFVSLSPQEERTGEARVRGSSSSDQFSPSPQPSPLQGEGASMNSSASLEELIPPFENFCRFAMERNKALVENLLKKMAQFTFLSPQGERIQVRGSSRLNHLSPSPQPSPLQGEGDNPPPLATSHQSSSPQKIAVLVSGGFHTDGMMKLLREQNVSYVVITPKIDKIDETKNYMDVFARDPLPLEKLFMGEPISLLGQRLPMADRTQLTGRALWRWRHFQSIRLGAMAAGLNAQMDKAKVIITEAAGKLDIKLLKLEEKALGGGLDIYLRVQFDANSLLGISVSKNGRANARPAERVNGWEFEINVIRMGWLSKALQKFRGSASWTERLGILDLPKWVDDHLNSANLKYRWDSQPKQITGAVGTGFMISMGLSVAAAIIFLPTAATFMAILNGLIPVQISLISLAVSVVVSIGLFLWSPHAALISGWMATIGVHAGWNTFVATPANAFLDSVRARAGLRVGWLTNSSTDYRAQFPWAYIALEYAQKIKATRDAEEAMTLYKQAMAKIPSEFDEGPRRTNSLFHHVYQKVISLLGNALRHANRLKDGDIFDFSIPSPEDLDSDIREWDERHHPLIGTLGNLQEKYKKAVEDGKHVKAWLIAHIAAPLLENGPFILSSALSAASSVFGLSSFLGIQSLLVGGAIVVAWSLAMAFLYHPSFIDKDGNPIPADQVKAAQRKAFLWFLGMGLGSMLIAGILPGMTGHLAGAANLCQVAVQMAQFALAGYGAGAAAHSFKNWTATSELKIAQRLRKYLGNYLLMGGRGNIVVDGVKFTLWQGDDLVGYMRDSVQTITNWCSYILSENAVQHNSGGVGSYPVGYSMTIEGEFVRISVLGGTASILNPDLDGVFFDPQTILDFILDGRKISMSVTGDRFGLHHQGLMTMLSELPRDAKISWRHVDPLPKLFSQTGKNPYPVIAELWIPLNEAMKRRDAPLVGTWFGLRERFEKHPVRVALLEAPGLENLPFLFTSALPLLSAALGLGLMPGLIIGALGVLNYAEDMVRAHPSVLIYSKTTDSYHDVPVTPDSTIVKKIRGWFVLMGIGSMIISTALPGLLGNLSPAALVILSALGGYLSGAIVHTFKNWAAINNNFIAKTLRNMFALGNWLLVSTPSASTSSPKWGPFNSAKVVMVVLVVLAVAARLINLDYNGAFIDEAFNIAWGQWILGGKTELLMATGIPNLWRGWVQIPITSTPIYPLLAAIVHRAGGLAAVRLVSAIAGAASSVLVYLTTKDLAIEWLKDLKTRVWAPVLAFALYAFSPMAILTSRLADQRALAGLGFIGGLLLLNRGLKKNASAWMVIFAAVALGLSGAFWSGDYFIGIAAAIGVVLVRWVSSLRHNENSGDRISGKNVAVFAVVFSALSWGLWYYMQTTGYGTTATALIDYLLPRVLFRRTNEAMMVATVIVGLAGLPLLLKATRSWPERRRWVLPAIVIGALLIGILFLTAQYAPFWAGSAGLFQWPNMDPVTQLIHNLNLVHPGDTIVMLSLDSTELHNVWELVRSFPGTNVMINSPWESISAHIQFLHEHLPRLLVVQYYSGTDPSTLEVVKAALSLGYTPAAAAPIADPAMNVITQVYVYAGQAAPAALPSDASTPFPSALIGIIVTIFGFISWKFLSPASKTAQPSKEDWPNDSSLLAMPAFSTKPGDLQFFAGPLNEADGLYSWLDMTDHIHVQFISPEEVEGDEFLQPKIMNHEYYYRLPSNLNIHQLMLFIDEIQKLSETPKEPFLGDLGREIMDFSIRLSRAITHTDAEVRDIISTLFSIGERLTGLPISGSTYKDIRSMEHSSAVTPRLEMFWSDLSQKLSSWEDQPSGKVAEMASDLILTAVRLQIEGVTYFRGLRQQANEVKWWTQRPMRRAIGINKLKGILAKARKTRDVKKIAQAEIEAIQSVLTHISPLPGGKFHWLIESSPRQGTKHNSFACLGRSALAAQYLAELGIEMRAIIVQEFEETKQNSHISLLSLLADGRYWVIDPSSMGLDSGEIYLPKAFTRATKSMIVDIDQRNLRRIQITTLQNGLLSSFFHNVGVAYFSNHLFSQALDCFQKALLQNPEGYLAHSYLGRIFIEQGDYNRAIIHLNESIKLNPFDDITHLYLGLASVYIGNDAEAFQFFNKSSQLNPENGLAFINMALIYSRQSEYDKAIPLYHTAIEAFQASLKKGPTDSDVKKYLAQAYKNIGIDYFQKAYSIVDEERDQSISEFRIALDFFQMALELDPGNDDIRGNILRCYQNIDYAYYQKEEYDKAITASLESLELFPLERSVLQNLGQNYYMLMQYDMAIYYYQKALELDPENADLLLNIGDVYFEMGDFPAAADNYEAALLINPSSEELAQKLRAALKPDDTPSSQSEPSTPGSWLFGLIAIGERWAKEGNALQKWMAPHLIALGTWWTANAHWLEPLASLIVGQWAAHNIIHWALAYFNLDAAAGAVPYILVALNAAIVFLVGGVVMMRGFHLLINPAALEKGSAISRMLWWTTAGLGVLGGAAGVWFLIPGAIGLAAALALTGLGLLFVTGLEHKNINAGREAITPNKEIVLLNKAIEQSVYFTRLRETAGFMPDVDGNYSSFNRQGHLMRAQSVALSLARKYGLNAEKVKLFSMLYEIGELPFSHHARVQIQEAFSPLDVSRQANTKRILDTILNESGLENREGMAEIVQEAIELAKRNRDGLNSNEARLILMSHEVVDKAEDTLLGSVLGFVEGNTALIQAFQDLYGLDPSAYHLDNDLDKVDKAISKAALDYFNAHDTWDIDLTELKNYHENFIKSQIFTKRNNKIEESGFLKAMADGLSSLLRRINHSTENDLIAFLQLDDRQILGEVKPANATGSWLFGLIAIGKRMKAEADTKPLWGPFNRAQAGDLLIRTGTWWTANAHWLEPGMASLAAMVFGKAMAVAFLESSLAASLVLSLNNFLIPIGLGPITTPLIVAISLIATSTAVMHTVLVWGHIISGRKTMREILNGPKVLAMFRATSVILGPAIGLSQLFPMIGINWLPVVSLGIAALGLWLAYPLIQAHRDMNEKALQKNSFIADVDFREIPLFRFIIAELTGRFSPKTQRQIVERLSKLINRIYPDESAHKRSARLSEIMRTIRLKNVFNLIRSFPLFVNITFLYSLYQYVLFRDSESGGFILFYFALFVYHRFIMAAFVTPKGKMYLDSNAEDWFIDHETIHIISVNDPEIPDLPFATVAGTLTEFFLTGKVREDRDLYFQRGIEIAGSNDLSNILDLALEAVKNGKKLFLNGKAVETWEQARTRSRNVTRLAKPSEPFWTYRLGAVVAGIVLTRSERWLGNQSNLQLTNEKLEDVCFAYMRQLMLGNQPKQIEENLINYLPNLINPSPPGSWLFGLIAIGERWAKVGNTIQKRLAPHLIALGTWWTANAHWLEPSLSGLAAAVFGKALTLGFLNTTIGSALVASLSALFTPIGLGPIAIPGIVLATLIITSTAIFHAVLVWGHLLSGRKGADKILHGPGVLPMFRWTSLILGPAVGSAMLLPTLGSIWGPSWFLAITALGGWLAYSPLIVEHRDMNKRAQHGSKVPAPFNAPRLANIKDAWQEIPLFQFINDQFRGVFLPVINRRVNENIAYAVNSVCVDKDTKDNEALVREFSGRVKVHNFSSTIKLMRSLSKKSTVKEKLGWAMLTISWIIVHSYIQNPTLTIMMTVAILLIGIGVVMYFHFGFPAYVHRISKNMILDSSLAEEGAYHETVHLLSIFDPKIKDIPFATAYQVVASYFKGWKLDKQKSSAYKKGLEIAAQTPVTELLNKAMETLKNEYGTILFNEKPVNDWNHAILGYKNYKIGDKEPDWTYTLGGLIGGIVLGRSLQWIIENPQSATDGDLEKISFIYMWQLRIGNKPDQIERNLSKLFSSLTPSSAAGSWFPKWAWWTANAHWLEPSFSVIGTLAVAPSFASAVNPFLTSSLASLGIAVPGFSTALSLFAAAFVLVGTFMYFGHLLSGNLASMGNRYVQRMNLQTALVIGPVVGLAASLPVLGLGTAGVIATVAIVIAALFLYRPIAQKHFEVNQQALMSDFLQRAVRVSAAEETTVSSQQALEAQLLALFADNDDLGKVSDTLLPLIEMARQGKMSPDQVADAIRGSPAAAAIERAARANRSGTLEQIRQAGALALSYYVGQVLSDIRRADGTVLGVTSRVKILENDRLTLAGQTLAKVLSQHAQDLQETDGARGPRLIISSNRRLSPVAELLQATNLTGAERTLLETLHNQKDLVTSTKNAEILKKRAAGNQANANVVFAGDEKAFDGLTDPDRKNFIHLFNLSESLQRAFDAMVAIATAA